jgi:hypothetical protein
MRNDAFLAMLRQIHVFVRPTATDGDSLALKEAAWFGRKLIATDVVPRPKGTLLFRYGDAEGLARQIRTALVEPSAGLCEPGVDGGQIILDMYRRLAGDESKRRALVEGLREPNVANRSCKRS